MVFFQSKKKIILISIGMIAILLIVGFFVFEKKIDKEIIKKNDLIKKEEEIKVEKKEEIDLIKKQKETEYHYLNKEEKDQLKIDQNEQIKGKKIKDNLGGEVWVVESMELPKWLDSDKDEISDEQEKKQGTDPFKQDSDNDGLSDFFEFKIGTDPKNPNSN